MEAMHALWVFEQSDGLCHSPDLQSVKAIYGGTAGPCPPRRLISRLYTRRSRPTWRPSSSYPFEFVADLVVEFGTFPKPTDDFSWEDSAQYQEVE